MKFGVNWSLRFMLRISGDFKLYVFWVFLFCVNLGGVYEGSIKRLVYCKLGMFYKIYYKEFKLELNLNVYYEIYVLVNNLYDLEGT